MLISKLKVFILMTLGLILLLLKPMEKLLPSSGTADSPWEFSATRKRVSPVTKVKDKTGAHHFFKVHFTPTPAPFRILIKNTQTYVTC